MTTALEIRGLSKRFGTVDVLKSIDLTLEKGGFLVLVGPSGCGKSTLLNTIAGLESVSAGEIRIDGQLVNGLHPSKRDIAMVFQSYALYPNSRSARTSPSAWRCAKCRRKSAPRRWRSLPKLCRSSTCSTAGRASSPAGSASASPWAAPWCASRGSSCSTSRSRTWTPSCASICGSRSSACTRRPARPPSMSPMTRSRQ